MFSRWGPTRKPPDIFTLVVSCLKFVGVDSSQVQECSPDCIAMNIRTLLSCQSMR